MTTHTGTRRTNLLQPCVQSCRACHALALVCAASHSVNTEVLAPAAAMKDPPAAVKPQEFFESAPQAVKEAPKAASQAAKQAASSAPSLPSVPAPPGAQAEGPQLDTMMALSVARMRSQRSIRMLAQVSSVCVFTVIVFTICLPALKR